MNKEQLHLLMNKLGFPVGLWAQNQPSLQGTTGQLFVGTRSRPLSFDAAYQDRLWACTTAMVDDVLGAS